jgi:hypothetical protein
MADDRAEVASVAKRANVARFEVLSAVLLKIHVFWDVTTCRLIKSDVSMDHITFIFRVKQSKLLFLDSLN